MALGALFFVALLLRFVTCDDCFGGADGGASISANIEKNIERFAFILDINTLVGNDMITKYKRRTIIKDILDLILLHTDWLKKQPNNRIEAKSTKFGIFLMFGDYI